jgi:hypothetical protein
MKHFGQELTLTNMLTDPMVRTVMAADRVHPQELAAMLAGIAETLSPPREHQWPLSSPTRAE